MVRVARKELPGTRGDLGIRKDNTYQGPEKSGTNLAKRASQLHSRVPVGLVISVA